MGKVTVIPSTLNPLTQMPIGAVRKRRVAAYARVSTDSDEQFTSYEAQVKVYSDMIKRNPEWEFVDVYSDEGITGTNRKKRDGFNRMIQDCYDGKIDLIITKSISRFARNTLDAVGLSRELKKKGIEVFFEKESLWTFENTSEFVLTVLASAAQEESRSISENVTMGKRWAMQAGKTSWAYKNFLGYKKNPETNKIEIIPDEAALVTQIYRWFLNEGKTCSGIASMLNKMGVRTPSGKEGCKWTKNTVCSILTNEKYKGDSLMQKTYTTDFLEHTHKKNNGELAQYYADNTHPAIIGKGDWEMIQTELKRRKGIGASYSGSSPFASRLICEDCGGFYGPKVWHSTDKYRKVVYQCNGKFDRKHPKCQTPAIGEDEIKSMFVRAYNQAMVNKEQLVSDANDLIALLTDTSELDGKIAKLEAEIEVISELVGKMVRENSTRAQNQTEYEAKYNELAERYEKANAELNGLREERGYRKGQVLKLQAFIDNILKSKEVLTEWDCTVWNILVSSGIVHKDGSITFKFNNGTEITVKR